MQRQFIQNEQTFSSLYTRRVVWWVTSFMLWENLGYICNLKFSFQHPFSILLWGYVCVSPELSHKLILKTDWQPNDWLDSQSFGCQIITLRRAHTKNSMCIRGHSKIQHIEPCKGVRWSPTGCQTDFLNRQTPKLPKMFFFFPLGGDGWLQQLWLFFTLFASFSHFKFCVFTVSSAHLCCIAAAF